MSLLPEDQFSCSQTLPYAVSRSDSVCACMRVCVCVSVCVCVYVVVEGVVMRTGTSFSVQGC